MLTLGGALRQRAARRGAPADPLAGVLGVGVCSCVRPVNQAEPEALHRCREFCTR